MITEQLKSFFSSDGLTKQATCLVVRGDGIPVYASQGVDSQSMSALVGGLWQAAHMLANFVPKDGSRDEIFRLSFDTSSKGVYILPLKVQEVEYFLSVVYYAEDNPGRLKNRMRMLREKLNTFLNSPESEEVKKEKFLFDKISDEEIDNVFSFVGK